MPSREPVLREMHVEDIPEVLEVQQPAAVAGLSAVFPQDEHPFPRQVIAERWLAEVSAGDTSCFVICRDGQVAGFVAVRGDEVLHFGAALEEWGSGLAVAAHDEIVDVLRHRGLSRARLRVYAANPRGRRFWEKLGWRPTGESSRGSMPPHAELLTYELALDRRSPEAISPSTSSVDLTSP
ncbi:GNAT family N-acetyltransferase [Nocardioides astragali]|uniref:GNAT family N-acetyltransferase n=1 Tax=Nocardioides astragali TaxID=1776736 RepID=A0ABW2N8X5_9ACTN|nr:GNAT family protein [Nocardioides astragali]